jgi:hypothetical protein
VNCATELLAKEVIVIVPFIVTVSLIYDACVSHDISDYTN